MERRERQERQERARALKLKRVFGRMVCTKSCASSVVEMNAESR